MKIDRDDDYYTEDHTGSKNFQVLLAILLGAIFGIVFNILAGIIIGIVSYTFIVNTSYIVYEVEVDKDGNEKFIREIKKGLFDKYNSDD